MVDCRGDQMVGRWHLLHDANRAPSVSYQQLPINRLSLLAHRGGVLKHFRDIEREFLPLLRALEEGKSVLIHCTYGNHRSALVALMVYVVLCSMERCSMGVSRDPAHLRISELEQIEHLARNDFQKLRSICEFSERKNRDHAHTSDMAYCFFILLSHHGRRLQVVH